MVGERRYKDDCDPQKGSQNMTLEDWKRYHYWANIRHQILNWIAVHSRNTDWRCELVMNFVDVAINPFMM